MLTYAFDLLALIYQEEGYAPTEIPALILRHNLHGLEICPRAAQLAGLALVFKAREKSRRFFQPEHLVRPHIIELQNITFAEGELADYFKVIGINPSSFILHPSSFIPHPSSFILSPAAPPVRGGEELRLAHPAVPRRTGHRQSPPRHRGEGTRRPALPARDAPQSPARTRTSRGAHSAVSRCRG
jgi:hypothetical protein